MAGGMFAGHDQSGGELIEKDGKKYKLFYGMSSSTAMEVSLILRVVRRMIHFGSDSLRHRTTLNLMTRTLFSRNMLVVLRITEHQKEKQFNYHTVVI